MEEIDRGGFCCCRAMWISIHSRSYAEEGFCRGCMWGWFVVELCGYGYSRGVMWRMSIVEACGGGCCGGTWIRLVKVLCGER